MSAAGRRAWLPLAATAAILGALGLGGAFLLRDDWLAMAGLVAFVAWAGRDMWRSVTSMHESLITTDYDRLLTKHGLAGGTPRFGLDVHSPEFADLLTLPTTGSKGGADARTESSESLLRRQAVRVFMERTDHLAEARAEAERWVGSTPRSAKRLANRLMFTVAVAATSGLLTTDSGVRGAHLGKWVALAESWPRLAALVQQDPGLLEHLEGVAPQAEVFASALEQYVPNARDVGRLRRLLLAEPSLGDAVWSLTRGGGVAAVGASDAGSG